MTERVQLGTHWIINGIVRPSCSPWAARISIFSKLDGDSAYWSVPIRDEDIPKTAFTYNPTRTIRVFCYVIWFNLRTCNVSEDY